MDKKIMLCDNLKYYREKNNLTQTELADIICFSPKSISKWESGKGIPSVETTAELAEVFHISIDELIYGESSETYYLAIDGGGTKTLFVLADAYGNVLKTVKRGSSNPNDIGMENAKLILGDGIREACNGYFYRDISAYAGISGGKTGNNCDVLNKYLGRFGFKSFNNGSDIDNVVALGDGCDAVYVILGTGIIAYAKSGNRIKRISGWGQFFDDGGSGYNLGRDAIHADLMYIDGIGQKTLISELIRKRIGESCDEHLQEFYKRGKRYIASFSEIVFEAYLNGDPAANDILKRNMKAVAEIVNTGCGFIGKESVNVFFVGGISERADIVFPVIKKYLNNTTINLKTFDREPVYGALKLAMKERL